MENGGTTSEAEGTSSEFRCVECGTPVKSLYIQYSPGNIRLIKCGSCKSVADDYIECEAMILVIDLILHKPKAYRHLFYNRFTNQTVNSESLLWKSLLAFLILDMYRVWVLNNREQENSLFGVVSSISNFGKIMSVAMIGNIFYFGFMLHGTRKFLSVSAGFYSWKQILLVVLFLSYFKIFFLAMMVWEFPSFAIFIVDMLVLSSNLVALKVISDSAMIKCLAVCVMAHGLKILASQTNVFVTPNLTRMLRTVNNLC